MKTVRAEVKHRCARVRMPDWDEVENIKETERVRRERLRKLIHGAARAKIHMLHAQDRGRIKAAKRWRIQVLTLLREIVELTDSIYLWREMP